jgi:hypothetical protein
VLISISLPYYNGSALTVFFYKSPPQQHLHQSRCGVGWRMPDKKEFIIFVLLCVIALGLGYWYGLPDKPSGQRAEVSPPPTPTPTPPPVGTFINTLGMKFVPVAGTEVAFCIWETRVKDYAAYAAANAGVDMSWKNPGYTQAGTHPVARVSWNHAQAFCAWLTKKELAAGKIKAGQRYRLPTDAEWSVAVGLNNETGNTPEERNARIKNAYPWGNKSWPPPKGAGNYIQELNVDPYLNTSPVENFDANMYGIYDLDGNVREWVEDWHSPTAMKWRVMRGACWKHSSQIELFPSYRTWASPYSHFSDLGFRCVLADGSGQ